MRLYGWFGLLLLLVSEIFLSRRIEPFYSWFYCFAWWSYILLADNLLLVLRGRSLLTTRRRELWSMLPLSVVIWLLFEGYNLVIRNWAYEGVPSQLWIRWPGYAAAFATVLPGIFVTSDLMEYILFRWREQPCASEFERLPAAPPTAPSPVFVGLGAALSAAPFFGPRYFFSTVWLGPIMLLDPLVEKAGIRSLSLYAASGERRKIWSLLLGGLACGMMWEFWNFWAGSKWIYSVPFFGGWKIFEMPLLGFLGFPPFALECWILYQLLRSVRCRLKSPVSSGIFWICVIVFSFAMFRALDSHTVFRFAMQDARSISL
jgi:hypothetical protein